MKQPILVTYATRFGSTAEIARAIGAVLHDEGESVEVCVLDDVETITGYAAVVLGSAIRGGRWLPEAVSFLDAYRTRLSHIPVAYFTVCMTLHENTEANRRIVSEYHQPLLEDFSDICPVSIGMFAGKVNYDLLPFAVRLMAKASKIPQGDWRDWQEIGIWARGLVPLFANQLELSLS